jgi:protein SCO1/2
MAATAIVAFLLAAACSSSPPELAGFVRTPLPEVGGQTLPDAGAGGEAFAMRASEGRLLLVYFGFTNCPDVCPTTLADIRAAFRDLGDAAEQVEVAMVTVDPDRDTDEILTGYVQSFVPGAHALRTTDDDALLEVATAFGAGYEVSVDADGTVEVIHTAHVFVVDDAGLIQVTWPFGTEPSDMVSDLEILLDA